VRWRLCPTGTIISNPWGCAPIFGAQARREKAISQSQRQRPSALGQSFRKINKD
jgi:hypothetical protein